MLLNLTNDIAEIEKLCDAVKKFCEENKIPEQKYHDIIMILDELVTNVIKYAYPGKKGTCSVKLLYYEENEKVFIEIKDSGVAFDPLSRFDPDVESSIEERGMGGLGIFIVKQLSDSIEYARIQDKNQLVIKVSAPQKYKDWTDEECSSIPSSTDVSSDESLK